MFQIHASLTGGAGAFRHDVVDADRAAVGKVDRSITAALHHLNEAATKPAPPGPAVDPKVNVTFNYEVAQDGEPFCVSATTWFKVNAHHQAVIAKAFHNVGAEAKGAGKR